MIRSMTGFGKATGEVDGEHVSVELSAVNHRFFECSIRTPFGWSGLDIPLRDALHERVARGKLNVFVNRRRGAGSHRRVQLDHELAEQYVAAGRDLARTMNSTQALSLDVLARLEGVFFFDEDEQDLEALFAALRPIVDQALAQLNSMRETEGAALATAIREQLSAMRDAVAVIEVEVPTITENYAARLRDRVAELGGDPRVTEDRLALEVALLAEKTDVTEELVRLKAHFDHVDEHLARGGPIGRELNFLAQEIQREANTLGSKLREIGVTREVLRIKAELEKLREQLNNIE